MRLRLVENSGMLLAIEPDMSVKAVKGTRSMVALTDCRLGIHPYIRPISAEDSEERMSRSDQNNQISMVKYTSRPPMYARYPT